MYNFAQTLNGHEYRKIKNSVEKALQEQGHSLHVATRPRTIDLEYRGGASRFSSPPFLEEFTLKASCSLKGAAVSAGKLAPLFCDNGMAIVQPKLNGKLDEKLLAGANVAREQASTLAEAGDHWDRDQVGILESFPTVAQAEEGRVTLQALEQVQDCRLYQFVSPGLQSHATTIIEIVSTLRDNRAPKIPSVAGNDFSQKVVERLGYFCRACGGDKEEVVGRAAAELRLKQAHAKSTAATLTLPDTRRIGHFNWRLTEDIALAVTTTAGALLKYHLEGPPAGSASSSASVGLLKLAKQVAKTKAQSGAQNKKSKAKKKNNTDDAAMRTSTKALFS